ncbi:unnamed protein product [Mucor hiemalis]
MIHTPVNTRLPDNKRLSSSFSVKRKKINFNLLDTQILRNNSSTSLLQPLPELNSIKEKEDEITELRNKLTDVNRELHASKHKCHLMENERKEFESNMIEKCSKEKQSVELELKLLKEVHIDKVQSLSTSLNNAFNTISALRNQLKNHNIEEDENVDVNALLVSDSTQYKQDAQFIQDAYNKVKQETHINHPLWANIRVRVCQIECVFFIILTLL